MCQQHSQNRDRKDNAQHAQGAQEAFPWELGVYDAHCHPTDTPASVSKISSMKARVLTIMATREQDQDLVAGTCVEYGVKNPELLKSGEGGETQRIVPAFGWHPWFSHQIYDDTTAAPSYDGTPEGKRAHYDAVLQPKPSSKDPAFSDGLPEPRALSALLEETRARLREHPYALVGEVGVDKAFRVPENWTADQEASRNQNLTPGSREGRLLSPHRVSMTHQTAILQAQLRLAGELGRAAHGALYEALAQTWKGHKKEVLSRREKNQIAMNAENFSSSDESEDDDAEVVSKAKAPAKSSTGHKITPMPFPPRICLHSYSGSVDFLKQYLHPSVPAKIFCSFSIVINWGQAGGGDKAEDVIRALPDNRILVESDLDAAGKDMDSDLEEVARKICEIKGWNLRQGVAQLAQNWHEFIFDD
ncbi:uncharacterized protein B0I36DRAFT_372996 [Microdochium trichocladiopsis]|uniref:Cut9 interacting protein Scn1 n=1 Tax=Microdochium trichocladiopsis TaxID=1682393 RepID=A0A9P9BX05_9PEZI|nr:uncharacterized protein B0I36DRAFT_372996 [Microdochium trichocladiopsis]KAH7035611.1 hypothetical protein B0I36DRAFT_372996 [Microdochium trichocladiopsis]